MTVSLVQWHAVIGIFNCRSSVIFKSCRYNVTSNFISAFGNLLFYYHYQESAYIALLQYHGDIELNPGLKKLKKNSVSVCHWNLNGLSLYNFSNFTRLKAYISMYKYDFICLSETYLDSATPGNLLEIDGYNLVRADHPNDTKRGRVYIYYKESLNACLSYKLTLS